MINLIKSINFDKIWLQFDSFKIGFLDTSKLSYIILRNFWNLYGLTRILDILRLWINHYFSCNFRTKLGQELLFLRNLKTFLWKKDAFDFAGIRAQIFRSRRSRKHLFSTKRFSNSSNIQFICIIAI